METDDREEGAALDGSPAAAMRLLAELAALAGQQHAGTPVLELMVGEIVTFASVASDAACLTVTARLPPCGPAGYLPAGAALQQRLGQDGIDCRWHADEGCYVAVRTVPLATLRDERSLMDAILDTADAARDWHAHLAEGRRGPSA
ncbi:hypothetical protein [Pseudoduganella chitinolytica]|uniref:Type III secretion system chaperone n=1 Tax=Pseudoduganella chitinolytica TaxID=34070 RepID=A0ABY8B8S6_9BURK|nr:hypothetical protein [Pseudoduganella chitinolytica]WEF32215.1 hypothetical protein PX653_22785 [Pseudoduganella chitinolytica]